MKLGSIILVLYLPLLAKGAMAFIPGVMTSILALSLPCCTISLPVFLSWFDFHLKQRSGKRYPLHYDSLIFHLYPSPMVMCFCYGGGRALKLPRLELPPSCFICFWGHSGDGIMKLRKKNCFLRIMFSHFLGGFCGFRAILLLFSATTSCRTRH
ncbi:hypothetical protein AOQ84DRAFT_19270 [Glonium stellatum]|uniref:Uncharacterized protein n=1 Tax=Glonium stellatum TaxID=574774 RepID=A0A8E2FEC2_9PEZI|nr:hypothetical protein AOQ84DRAFT_19270 [Glonium stellatum]